MEKNNGNSMDEYYTLAANLFDNGVINISKVQFIEYKLKQIPKDEKHIYSEFVNYFIDLCFDNDVSNDLDKNEFKEKTPKEEKEVVSEILKSEKKEITNITLNSKSLLDKLASTLKDYFETYKGYFLIKLENDPTKEFEVIFLYEENYFIKPLQKKVENDFANCEFSTLDEFHDNISQYGKNYICVLLLMSKMNNEESLNNLKSKIETIISPTNFETFEKYSLVFGKEDIEIDKSNVRRDFLNEIVVVLGTYISNIKINFEEEKIIKTLCSSFRTPLIFYKLLSSGFSGAKVLEIRPKKSNSYDGEKKYIIKFGLNKDEKLKHEINSYNEFIHGLKGFNDYYANYSSTLTHEGILYNFAISESGVNSYSYSDILNDNCDGLKINKKDIIRELFSIPLFELWKKEHQTKTEQKVKILYKDYLNPVKIFETLGTILNKEKKLIHLDELYVNFNKIWEHSLKCYSKVCHGDLHTENFFIDNEKNIYLIDFGYTNHRHSLVDYSSLECSIKFKHIPRYMPLDELLQIEDELMSDNSFQLSNTLSNNRESLKDLLEIITNIRYCSNTDFINPNEFQEYYISLFIMTFRQIQYKDMNQLYAYHSAKKLAKKIVNDLGL